MRTERPIRIAGPTAPLLFPLSSTSADELRHTAGRLADWVQAHDDVDVAGPGLHPGASPGAPAGTHRRDRQRRQQS